MHGLVEGARGRRRPKRTLLTHIAEWTEIGITTCVREAEDWQKWRRRFKSSKYRDWLSKAPLLSAYITTLSLIQDLHFLLCEVPSVSSIDAFTRAINKPNWVNRFSWFDSALSLHALLHGHYANPQESDMRWVKLIIYPQYKYNGNIAMLT